ncbi:hypothetical protein CALVIDRAFT_561609 [Calocera viscosa TUFC12733]|uniref:Uncharacterized protein n=1 Tax=Calocera viscosa (strain TUFC12733) TaxID=1330018 RepID=A0A167PXB7_CALVF|nr:hypothetical protein CALVIDRAFT_561609 [Calocera viscosa TUFC12733]
MSRLPTAPNPPPDLQLILQHENAMTLFGEWIQPRYPVPETQLPLVAPLPDFLQTAIPRVQSHIVQWFFQTSQAPTQLHQAQGVKVNELLGGPRSRAMDHGARWLYVFYQLCDRLRRLDVPDEPPPPVPDAPGMYPRRLYVNPYLYQDTTRNHDVNARCLRFTTRLNGWADEAETFLDELDVEIAEWVEEGVQTEASAEIRLASLAISEGGVRSHVSVVVSNFALLASTIAGLTTLQFNDHGMPVLQAYWHRARYSVADMLSPAVAAVTCGLLGVYLENSFLTNDLGLHVPTHRARKYRAIVPWEESDSSTWPAQMFEQATLRCAIDAASQGIHSRLGMRLHIRDHMRPIWERLRPMLRPNGDWRTPLMQPGPTPVVDTQGLVSVVPEPRLDPRDGVTDGVTGIQALASIPVNPLARAHQVPKADKGLGGLSPPPSPVRDVMGPALSDPTRVQGLQPGSGSDEEATEVDPSEEDEVLEEDNGRNGDEGMEEDEVLEEDNGRNGDEGMEEDEELEPETGAPAVAPEHTGAVTRAQARARRDGASTNVQEGRKRPSSSAAPSRSRKRPRRDRPSQKPLSPQSEGEDSDKPLDLDDDSDDEGVTAMSKDAWMAGLPLDIAQKLSGLEPASMTVRERQGAVKDSMHTFVTRAKRTVRFDRSPEPDGEEDDFLKLLEVGAGPAPTSPERERAEDDGDQDGPHDAVLPAPTVIENSAPYEVFEFATQDPGKKFRLPFPIKSDRMIVRSNGRQSGSSHMEVASPTSNLYARDDLRSLVPHLTVVTPPKHTEKGAPGWETKYPHVPARWDGIPIIIIHADWYRKAEPYMLLDMAATHHIFIEGTNPTPIPWDPEALGKVLHVHTPVQGLLASALPTDLFPDQSKRTEKSVSSTLEGGTNDWYFHMSLREAIELSNDRPKSTPAWNALYLPQPSTHTKPIAGVSALASHKVCVAATATKTGMYRGTNAAEEDWHMANTGGSYSRRHADCAGLGVGVEPRAGLDLRIPAQMTPEGPFEELYLPAGKFWTVFHKTASEHIDGTWIAGARPDDLVRAGVPAYGVYITCRDTWLQCSGAIHAVWSPMPVYTAGSSFYCATQVRDILMCRLLHAHLGSDLVNSEVIETIPWMQRMVIYACDVMQRCPRMQGRDFWTQSVRPAELKRDFALHVLWPLHNLMGAVYLVKEEDRLHAPNDEWQELWKDLWAQEKFRAQRVCATKAADQVIDWLMRSQVNYETYLACVLPEIWHVPARFRAQPADVAAKQGQKRALEAPPEIEALLGSPTDDAPADTGPALHAPRTPPSRGLLASEEGSCISPPRVATHSLGHANAIMPPTPALLDAPLRSPPEGDRVSPVRDTPRTSISAPTAAPPTGRPPEDDPDAPALETPRTTRRHRFANAAESRRHGASRDAFVPPDVSAPINAVQPTLCCSAPREAARDSGPSPQPVLTLGMPPGSAAALGDPGGIPLSVVPASSAQQFVVVAVMLQIEDHHAANLRYQLMKEVRLSRQDCEVDGVVVRTSLGALWSALQSTEEGHLPGPQYSRHHLWLSRVPRGIQEAGHMAHGGWHLTRVADMLARKHRALIAPVTTVMVNDPSGTLSRLYAREHLPRDRRLFVLSCELVQPSRESSSTSDGIYWLDDPSRDAPEERPTFPGHTVSAVSTVSPEALQEGRDAWEECAGPGARTGVITEERQGDRQAVLPRESHGRLGDVPWPPEPEDHPDHRRPGEVPAHPRPSQDLPPEVRGVVHQRLGTTAREWITLACTPLDHPQMQPAYAHYRRWAAGRRILDVLGLVDRPRIVLQGRTVTSLDVITWLMWAESTWAHNTTRFRMLRHIHHELDSAEPGTLTADGERMRGLLGYFSADDHALQSPPVDLLTMKAPELTDLARSALPDIAVLERAQRNDRRLAQYRARRA